jgi:hypothetical protein
MWINAASQHPRRIASSEEFDCAIHKSIDQRCYRLKFPTEALLHPVDPLDPDHLVAGAGGIILNELDRGPA